MAYKAIKTEHAGAKHGNGAYWGPKKDAKKESSKVRRRNGKRSVKQELLARFIGAFYQRRDFRFPPVSPVHHFADSEIERPAHGRPSYPTRWKFGMRDENFSLVINDNC